MTRTPLRQVQTTPCQTCGFHFLHVPACPTRKQVATKTIISPDPVPDN